MELLERKLNIIKGYIRVQPLNWNTKKLNIPFAIFLSLSIYLSCFSNHRTLWIAISVAIALFVCFKPKYFLISFAVFAIALIVHMLMEQTHIHKIINGNYEIKNVLKHGFVIKDDKANIYVNTKLKFNVGDVVHISGSTSEIKNTTSFDAITYFKSMNIINQIQYSKIAIVSQTNDIRVQVQNYITQGNAEYSMLSPLMLMGIKDEMTSGVYSSAIEMNVVHIFVISGFHMSLMFLIIKKSLSSMKINDDIASWVATIPLFVYLFLLNFQISATRAFLLIFLSVINRTIFKKKFNGMELISIVMAIMFMWKPYSIYSLSFILTFMSTFFIFMITRIKIENKLLKFIFISFAMYSINIPINVYLNKKITLVGPIYSIIITPLFTLMFLLTGLLFPFKEVIGKLNVGFLWLIDVLKSINHTLDAYNSSLNQVIAVYSALFFIFWIVVYGKRVYEKRGLLLSWWNYLINLSR